MIVIWYNGKQHSDYGLYFIECAPAELPLVEEIAAFLCSIEFDSKEEPHSAIRGVADDVAWRERGGGMSIADWVRCVSYGSYYYRSADSLVERLRTLSPTALALFREHGAEPSAMQRAITQIDAERPILLNRYADRLPDDDGYLVSFFGRERGQVFQGVPVLLQRLTGMDARGYWILTFGPVSEPGVTVHEHEAECSPVCAFQDACAAEVLP